MRRTIAIALVGVAMCLAGAAPTRAAAESAATDALVTRSFEVRHRALSDAALLVNAILSSDGSLKLQPRLRSLEVEDLPEVLARVETALRAFDVPARNVEVTLTLLLGSDVREGAGATPPLGPREISREIRGVSEALGDFTKWTSYSLLGSQSVTGIEGRSLSARLSEDYRVTFEVESIQPATARAPQGTITLSRLVLERIVRGEDGVERGEELYSTAIQLHVGKLLMVGAARSPESRRALFLTIKARPG